MFKELDNYDWVQVFCEPSYDKDVHGKEYEIRPYNRGFNKPNPAIPGLKIDCSLIHREDIIEILGIHEGKHDEDPWRIYGKLKDNRYFYLEAWCDYTGWD
jgi:hypothetical protein